MHIFFIFSFSVQYNFSAYILDFPTHVNSANHLRMRTDLYAREINIFHFVIIS